MDDVKEEKITVEISKTGEMVVGVQGVKGQDCEGLTKFLEEMGDSAQICKTDEYYEYGNKLSDTASLKLD